MGDRKGANALAHGPEILEFGGRAWGGGGVGVWGVQVGGGAALAKGGTQASFPIIWPRPDP